MALAKKMVMTRGLVLQVLQLPPRAQDQPAPLPREPEAAAPSAVPPRGRRRRALVVREGPRGRPLPSVHHLDGPLDGEVSRALGPAEIVGQDVRGDDRGEGGEGRGAPEEMDLRSGARVDLFVFVVQREGRVSRVSESEFFLFLLFLRTPRKKKTQSKKSILPSASRLATAPRRLLGR